MLSNPEPRKAAFRKSTIPRSYSHSRATNKYERPQEPGMVEAPPPQSSPAKQFLSKRILVVIVALVLVVAILGYYYYGGPGSGGDVTVAGTVGYGPHDAGMQPLSLQFQSGASTCTGQCGTTVVVNAALTTTTGSNGSAIYSYKVQLPAGTVFSAYVERGTPGGGAEGEGVCLTFTTGSAGQSMVENITCV